MLDQNKEPLVTTLTSVQVIAPTFFFYPGASVRIADECRILMDAGYKLSICTYNKGKNLPGLPIYRIPFTPKNLKPGPSYHRLYLDGLLLSRSFAVSLSKYPDIIHAHLHEGVLCSLSCFRRRRTPIIADLQDSLVDELIRCNMIKGTGARYRAVKLLEKFVSRRADYLISSSLPLYLQLNERYANKCSFLPDFVDTNRFSPRSKDISLLHQLKIPDRRKVVVYLGRLSCIQGIDLFMKSVAVYIRKYGNKDVHFLVMGTPNVEKYLIFARELKISDNVTFTGPIDYYNEAPRFLSLGDIAVSPKLKTSESNMKLLLYMSMGLPTVAFDYCVNRYFLGNNGVYVKEMNPEAFADAMFKALLLSNDCSIGDSLRERAITLFSKEKFQRRLLNIYDRVLNRKAMYEIESDGLQLIVNPHKLTIEQQY